MFGKRLNNKSKYLFMMLIIMAFQSTRAQDPLRLDPSSTETYADMTLSLSGEWICRLDPNDVGIRESWFTKPLPAETVKVQLPGTTNTNKLGQATTGADFGQLTPEYRYVGPAWYQRTIDIPANWFDRQISLHLERVLMRSTVWIDGKRTDEPIDYLGVPHEHPLGKFSPGKHTLTVRIDNRNVLNASLGIGHHYYDGMQTIWNGIVGRIELIAKPDIALELVRMFPSYKNGTIGIETTVINKTDADVKRPLQITIRKKDSKNIVAQAKYTIDATPGKSTTKHQLKLANQPLPWDEFTPNLYQAEITLGSGNASDTYTADIGFRDLGTKGYHLTINERPLFYRNNHDGCMFPLTGYPPTDVASWKRILQIYKDHGLNGIRFHSWTPPEAAFTAADELGIYIQSEHFWNKMDATPEMAQYCKQEMRVALDRYGNHPSNCYVLYGNELSGDLDMYAQWLKADRDYDPRHLYSVAAGRKVAGDDFYEYGAKMNWTAPNTDWNYSGYFKRHNTEKTPEITHELGEPVTHPDWDEISKYTGVLKPRLYEDFQQAAIKAGVGNQSAQFQKASGNITRLNYKHDIEALLRTPQSAGYNLLDMHDFPGQGSALVGWLDAFYDEKGFLSAKEFNCFGSATVPLARLPKFVFTDGEQLTVKAEVSHFGATALNKAVLKWTLRNDINKVVTEGKLAPVNIPVGSVTNMGIINCQLSSLSPKGTHLALEFTITGTPYANSWDIWVFPKPDNKPEPKDIVITDSEEAAVKALDKGRKVLLLANRLGKGTKPGAYACFKPPFWSTNYGFGQQSKVTGAIVRSNHPALSLFPTADVLDWQWQTLCADATEDDYDQQPTSAWKNLPQITNPNARGFELKDFPADYRPIVQPVADYQRPVKVGTIFELKTNNNGKLLICGYDIADSFDSRPAARQLRKSLLTYMASESFAPDFAVDNKWIISTFENTDKPLVMPAGYENAYIYVAAGGRHPSGEGNVSWDARWDGVARNDKTITYNVKGATVWADSDGIAWAGSKIRIRINVKEAIGGILKVRFHDWNRTGRRGIVRSEDGQKQQLGLHEDGKWLEFTLRREDSLDGIIMLEADNTSGPNLMITHMVIVPR